MRESSILNSVKKKIGLDISDESFDDDLIDCINAALAEIIQLGVGPEEGFIIEGYEEVWTEFVTSRNLLGFIPLLVARKVQLSFDTPLNSSVIQNIKDEIKELEWRINVEGDC